MSEAVILWIMAAQTTLLLAVIGLVARALNAHTTQCQEWQKKFLVEHGELRANQVSALKRLDRLESHILINGKL